MGKLVLLSLMHGSFEEGFSIEVNILDEGSRQILNIVHGKLAANTDLENKYLSWQIPYRKLVDGRMPMVGIPNSELKNDRAKLVSEIKTANQELDRVINDWLKREGEFSIICREIDRTLKNEQEEIRFIVNTQNSSLQKIPFLLWKDFFTHYHRAEAGLYLPVKNSAENNNEEKVKILAVFGSKEFIGNNTQIRIDNDWEIIKNHLSQESNAELIRLQEPTLDEFGDQMEEYCPQILFFAGHSFTDEDLTEGQIQLNQNDYITIEDLKYELIKAAKKGLKLAIFNSCDGMGIARQLQDIGISNIIVMREPVPDEVAHRFLRRFLERFAFGKSINLAVRRGREKLQRLERYYPGVVCLPVIWQNPAEPPLTWEQLGGIVTNKNNQKSVIWQSTVIQNPDTFESSSESENNNNSTINPNSSESFNEIQNPDTFESSSESENNNNTIVNPNSLELLGETLAKRYKIIKLLSRGGFGETYLASDIDLPGELQCVVKRLAPSNTDPQLNSIAERLFKTEAKSLFKLGKHNHIPRLHAFFQENGNFYLVQEFIDGEDLTSEFKSGHKWSEAKTIDFLRELLEILAYVHQENKIHRDIKPSNIIRRSSDNKLVLIDFGAVKEIFTSKEPQEQNNSTIAIGTSDYSPPEQMMGRPGKYSDIYALGILGMQALTGLSPEKIPRDPESLEPIWYELKINISPRLKYVLTRMVSFEYKNRFPDATKALNALPPSIIKQANISKIQSYFPKNSLILYTGIFILISILAFSTISIVTDVPNVTPKIRKIFKEN